MAAEKFFELRDGTRMCYVDSGEGRPVIFLPGWGEVKQCWYPYEKIVTDAGYRFITMDPRGTKKTTPSKTHPVTYQMLVDDLREFILGLGIHDYTIVGHSGGALSVMDYCGRYQDEDLRSGVMLDAPPRWLIAEGYDYAMRDNTYTAEQAYAENDYMTRDMHGYLCDFAKLSNDEIRNAEDPDKAASDWATVYMQDFHVDEMAELHRSYIEFDMRDVIPTIKVPLAYFYPKYCTMHVQGLWNWYRDNVKSEFMSAGFDSNSHFFCMDPEFVPAVADKLLEFLKK